MGVQEQLLYRRGRKMDEKYILISVFVKVPYFVFSSINACICKDPPLPLLYEQNNTLRFSAYSGEGSQQVDFFMDRQELLQMVGSSSFVDFSGSIAVLFTNLVTHVS